MNFPGRVSETDGIVRWVIERGFTGHVSPHTPTKTPIMNNPGIPSASSTSIAPVSPPALWAGRVLSGLAVAMMLFSGIIKLAKTAPVVDSFAQLGVPDQLARGIGVLELLCTALYVIPRTAILGAILLTGLFGGAILAHLRVGNPLPSHTLFPVYMGVFVWGGLFFRETRLRGLIPLRR